MTEKKTEAKKTEPKKPEIAKTAAKKAEPKKSEVEKVKVKRLSKGLRKHIRRTKATERKEAIIVNPK
jgi:hypothetical protein